MQKRGGGITAIELRDKTSELENYYQLHATFETVNSMGANFINTCLEEFAKTLKEEAESAGLELDVVMSILSNYVPNCVVRAEVSCKVEELNENPAYAEKFVQAVKIAQIEPFRAVTHNKGIMNGVDAVVLATGNDFRAVEAGVHAYASRDGQYRSLSNADIKDLEYQKKQIEQEFSEGKVSDDKIETKANELQKIIKSLEEKEERWFELSSKME